LSYLPGNSLLSCRLVNRSWNDAALNYLHQKSIYCVKINPRALNINPYCDFETSPVLPFLTSCHHSLTRLDFKSYVKFLTDIQHLSISDSPLGESHSESCIGAMARRNLSQVQSILELTPNMKTLDLNLFNSPQHLNPTFEMDTQEELPFRFPQLEMLRINVTWTNELIWDFLNKVFASAPNLRVLLVPYWASLEGQREAAMETIQRLLLRGVLLSCNSWWGVPMYKAVADTQKLKWLGVCLASGVYQRWEGVDAQQELLESQADHLETLFLLNGRYKSEDNNENVPKLRLPVMKMLRSASLCFCQIFAVQLDPKKVPFNMDPLTPEHVPSLRRLNLYTPYLGLGVIVDSPFRNLTQLVLQNNEDDYFPGVLRQVASRFPNLKKLHNLCILNLSSSDVALLASSWPDMEDLFLTFKSDRPQTNFNLVLNGVLAEGDSPCPGPFLVHFTSKSYLLTRSSRVHQDMY